MSRVDLPLIERNPYGVGAAAAASGLAVILSFASPIPLQARLPIAGVGAYGIIVSTWLGVNQTKPLSWRDVILLAGGAASTALSWYKLSNLIPQDGSEIDSKVVLAFCGASIASLAIPSMGKAFDLVRNYCARPRDDALLLDSD